MGCICETCPVRHNELGGVIATWAWFDMLVNRDVCIRPDPDDTDERAQLLDDACAQAGAEIAEEDRAEALLAVQAMMRCFRNRTDGICLVEQNI